MTTDSRRTDLVLRIFEELAASGRFAQGLRAGDIGSRLRELGEPLGQWEIRYELTRLESLGALSLDDASGRWHLAKATTRRRRSTA